MANYTVITNEFREAILPPLNLLFRGIVRGQLIDLSPVLSPLGTHLLYYQAPDGKKLLPEDITPVDENGKPARPPAPRGTAVKDRVAIAAPGGQ